MELFEWSRLHNQYREVSFARLPFSYHLWSPFLFMAFLRMRTVFGQTADWLLTQLVIRAPCMFLHCGTMWRRGINLQLDTIWNKSLTKRQVFFKCLKAVKVTFLIHEKKKVLEKKTQQPSIQAFKLNFQWQFNVITLFQGLGGIKPWL